MTKKKSTEKPPKELKKPNGVYHGGVVREVEKKGPTKKRESDVNNTGHEDK